MGVTLTTQHTQVDDEVQEPLHAQPPPPQPRSPAGGGLVAGLVGGAVLSLVMVFMNLAQGHDIWAGAKMAGLPFLGQEAVPRAGFALIPVFVGVVCHFAVSAVWGMLFARVVDGRNTAATLIGGLVWGVVVWLAMYYLVMPMLGAAELARSAPVGPAVFLHVVFGLTVAAAYLPYQGPPEE